MWKPSRCLRLCFRYCKLFKTPKRISQYTFEKRHGLLSNLQLIHSSKTCFKGPIQTPISLFPYRPLSTATNEQIKEVNAYNQLLQKAYLEKDIRMMFQLLDEMTNKGLPFHKQTYNWMLHAFELGKKPIKALMLLEELESKGIASSFAYATTLRTLISANNLEKALTLYRTMKEKGKKPDSMILNNLLSSCAACADSKNAIELFNEFEVFGISPTIETFTMIVSTLSQGDNPQLTIDWILKANKSLSTLLDGKVNFILSLIDKGFVQCSIYNHVEGLEILAELLSFDLKRSEIMMILTACLRRNPPNFEKFEKYYDLLLSKFGESSSSFVIYLDYLIKQKKVKEALKFGLDGQLKGFHLPSITNFLTDAIGIDVNDIDDVYFYLEQLRSENYQIPVEYLNAIICSCIKAGDLDRAYGTYLEMPNFKLVPTIHTFESLLENISGQSYVDTILKEMKKHEIPISTKIQDILSRN